MLADLSVCVGRASPSSGGDTPRFGRPAWRAEDGRERSKTFSRAEEAKRLKARLEGDLVAGTWIDPALAKVSVGEWTRQWRGTVMGLRPTTLGRLDSTLINQVLPAWGSLPLGAVTNADVRAWAAGMRASGLSPSTVRKAVFTLRQVLAAAVADRRIPFNPADNVPLPVEERGEQRFLTAEEVAALAEVIAPRFLRAATDVEDHDKAIAVLISLARLQPTSDVCYEAWACERLTIMDACRSWFVGRDI